MAVIRAACVWGMAAASMLLHPAQASAQYIGEAPPPLPTDPVGPESAPDALARNVRILAQSPRDYRALLGAGRAALDTGDPEAAVGFFGRAADVSPAAAAPHAGVGAALVALGEATDALKEFARAQKLGASSASFAADRGMARDLLGQQSLAQADYRLALSGTEPNEARRRLALSQAISGDRSAALATLAPLLQRSDVATNRVRAFVLALGGDADAADRALDSSVPGMSRSLDPFFRRLPGLTPAQKAAAVHLGVIPGGGRGDTTLAQGSALFPAPPARAASIAGPPDVPSTSSLSVRSDRLAGIDEILREPTPRLEAPAAPLARVAPPARSGRLASVQPPSRSPAVSASPVLSPRRLWVQLASGGDEGALAAQFTRLAARNPDVFDGIRPYVSEVDGRSKLLVGPFRNDEDRKTFMENLDEARIQGFSWTNPEGLPVRKLATP